MALTKQQVEENFGPLTDRSDILYDEKKPEPLTVTNDSTASCGCTFQPVLRDQYRLTKAHDKDHEDKYKELNCADDQR
jgi:hypothetical protein